MEIYIVRIFLESQNNPLNIGDIIIFKKFVEAKDNVIEFCEKNKLKLKDDNKFINNRYYMYEDFLSEQFIWIEKHNI
jgi:hypothetical protein